MNYSTETFDAVVALARTLRPNWDTPGLRHAIRDALARDDQPTIAELTYAVLRCCENFTIASPAVIALDGPHWRLAARSPYGPVAINCQRCRRTHMPAFDCQAEKIAPPPLTRTELKMAEWAASAKAAVEAADKTLVKPRDVLPAYTTQGVADA